MSRRLLIRLLHRLDRSPLPPSDGVRLALERELLELLDTNRRKHEPAVYLCAGWAFGNIVIGAA